METSNNNKFLDVLTSEDNVETALAILANAGEIHNRIRENFIEEIHKLCVSYGYTFKCDEGVRTASHNNWIHITDPKIIDVELIDFIRDEIKFSSKEATQTPMAIECVSFL